MSKRNANSTAARLVDKVVSGGQTGVDRAALDAALHVGIPIGGWCPSGRRSESGAIPACYPLTETPARSYAVRTEWNVRDADGTLIVVLGEISSGTRLTLDIARDQHKPWKVVHLRPPSLPDLFANEQSLNEQLKSVVSWVGDHNIRILNVAGPRGSSHRDVYPESHQFLIRLLERTTNHE